MHYKKADTLSDSVIIANSNQPYIIQTLSSPVDYGDDWAKWERYGIRQNSEMFKGMDYYSIDKNLLLMDITTAQLLILRTATAK